MAEKLFWGNEVAGTANASITSHQLNVDYPIYDGVISKIGFYSLTTGNLKTNIYNASAGVPTSLIWADDSGSSYPAVGWVYKEVTPFEVSSGSEYAAGAIGDTVGTYTYSTPGPSNRAFASGTYAPFTAPDPISGYTTMGWLSGAYAVVLYGWEPPGISSIDNSTIVTGQTRTLTGTDFMTSADPIDKIEICNNSVYASATVKTAQTNISNQTDTGVEFDCVTTGLSGPAWIFLTTDLGQINVTGLSVNVGVTKYAWIERSDGSISAYPHQVILV